MKIQIAPAMGSVYPGASAKTLVPVLFAGLLLTGCASTTLNTYPAAGRGGLCDGGSLGTLAVLPEAAWRADQKEPEKRQRMAEAAIQRVFETLPCASLEAPGGIAPFADWSARAESQLTADYWSRGVDTIAVIRLEELGPLLEITFSLPFLWSGANEADFRIRVLATRTGEVLQDLRVNQVTRGVFNIRPASWSEEELEAGLRAVIGVAGDPSP
ncbi:MAG: hypothetical protein ABW095_16500 [Candidatus Thiodiazotropha sp.]